MCHAPLELFLFRIWSFWVKLCGEKKRVPKYGSTGVPLHGDWGAADPRNTSHTHARVSLCQISSFQISTWTSIFISIFIKKIGTLGTLKALWLNDLSPRTCPSPKWVSMPNLMVLVKRKRYTGTCTKIRQENCPLTTRQRLTF